MEGCRSVQQILLPSDSFSMRKPHTTVDARNNIRNVKNIDSTLYHHHPIYLTILRSSYEVFRNPEFLNASRPIECSISLNFHRTAKPGRILGYCA